MKFRRLFWTLTLIIIFSTLTSVHSFSQTSYPGQWSYVTDANGTPVAWRVSRLPRHINPSDPLEDDWMVYDDVGFPYNPYSRVYGIGAALLPPHLSADHRSIAGSARVFLYGYGQNFGSTNPGPGNPNYPNPYYTDIHGTHHFIGAIEQYSPYLLWDPAHTHDNQSAGLVSYLLDPDPYHDDPAAMLHHAGWCLMADGKLFFAGGERDSCVDCSINPNPGLNYGYTFDNTLVSTNAYGLWSSPFKFPDYNTTGGYYNGIFNSTLYQMPGRRYAPGCLEMPNGNILVLGGDTGTGRELGEGPRDDTSYDAPTFMICDPSKLPSQTAWTSYWTDPSNVSYFNEGYGATSQRYELGTENPRMHVLSSGMIVYVGPTGRVYELDSLNPSLGWSCISSQNSNPDASPALQNNTYTANGNNSVADHLFAPSVLLPAHNNNNENPYYLNPRNAAEQALDRVMITGGSDGSLNHFGNEDGVMDRVDILDFKAKVRYVNESVTTVPNPMISAPTSQIWVPSIPNDLYANPRDPNISSERVDAASILLPNGTVFITNGSRKRSEQATADKYDHTTFIFDPNYFNPSTHQLGSWQRTADVPSNTLPYSNGAAGRRMNHSNALLLPSGLVLTDSTTEPATNPYPTMFMPPVLLTTNNILRSDRPIITSLCTREVGYDVSHSFALTYSNISSANPLTSVVMIRPSSTTHWVDSDQRLIRCHWMDAGNGRINVTPPFNSNTAPPGWYMVFLVDQDGCYSQAEWIHLTTDITSPCKLFTVIDIKNIPNLPL